MGARLRSWWQKTTKLIEVIGFIAVLVVAIALIFVEARIYGTGFTGKTLWDWLQLLIIPAVLAVGGYLFTFTISRNERKAADRHNQTEREIAQDNQREAALQEYIDKMSELLLHEKLRESKPEDEVRKIARVRTLTVLPRLDSKRKRSVLLFLHESGLIDKDKRIIDLNEADLSKAYLSEANLSGANLTCANLSKADLSEIRLNGAILIEANLHKVDLSLSNLREAILSGTILNEADLLGADLSEADLSGAVLNRANLAGTNLYKANLSGANWCEAILSGTNLSETILSSAVYLHEAILRSANLSEVFEANLSEANLSEANLSEAKVTTEQLDEAKSLKGATMPDGSIHP